MRYTVPQFIDVEDKILGPLTGRQFIIVLVACFAEAIMWKLLDFVAFLAFGLPLAAIAGVFAFMRINGQPFHYFLLNAVQTMQRPGVRCWDKALSDAEVRGFAATVPPPPPPPRVRKEPLAATKLAELSLIVNTGGTYDPDA